MFTCKVCNFMEWQCSCCSCCSIQLYISKGLYIITTYISTCTYVYISYVHAYMCLMYICYVPYVHGGIYICAYNRNRSPYQVRTGKAAVP